FSCWSSPVSFSMCQPYEHTCTSPLHDALPILVGHQQVAANVASQLAPVHRGHWVAQLQLGQCPARGMAHIGHGVGVGRGPPGRQDRKSTRLNSSHVKRSYAVFCLKKKII